MPARIVDLAQHVPVGPRPVPLPTRRPCRAWDVTLCALIPGEDGARSVQCRIRIDPAACRYRITRVGDDGEPDYQLSAEARPEETAAQRHAREERLRALDDFLVLLLFGLPA